MIMMKSIGRSARIGHTGRKVSGNRMDACSLCEVFFFFWGGEGGRREGGSENQTWTQQPSESKHVH